MSRLPAMVDVAVVVVALKCPKVGVDVAESSPNILVERREFKAMFGKVMVDVAVSVPNVPPRMFAFAMKELVVVELVSVEFVAKRFVVVALVVVESVRFTLVAVKLVIVPMVISAVARVDSPDTPSELAERVVATTGVVVIEPPVMVGLRRAMFVSWSIFCDCAICW